MKNISHTTIGHYRVNAEAFEVGTRDHDVKQNYEALLSAISVQAPFDILDFGCGPGRDLAHFKKLGHRVTGLDGCDEFCEMAREATSCEVLQQDFLQLSLPEKSFDGVFANASLFHIPSTELLRVLRQLNAALRDGGILFSSNPRGEGEGWNGERFGFYLEFEAYQDLLLQAGFKVVRHYFRPENMPRSQQPWLAVVSQKVGDKATKKTVKRISDD